MSAAGVRGCESRGGRSGGRAKGRLDGLLGIKMGWSWRAGCDEVGSVIMDFTCDCQAIGVNTLQSDATASKHDLRTGFLGQFAKEGTCQSGRQGWWNATECLHRRSREWQVVLHLQLFDGVPREFRYGKNRGYHKLVRNYRSVHQVKAVERNRQRESVSKQSRQERARSQHTR